MNIDKLFEDFTNLNVLIIGDVMVDSYSMGKVDRISPEAPVQILRLSDTEYRLGGAANVALNVKSMGAKVSIVSIIGKDDNGKLLHSLLNENDIDVHLFSEERKTTVKSRFMSGTHHLLRVDSEDDFQISEESSKSILGFVIENINKYNVIIFEDYDKGVLHKELIENVVELANKLKIPTLVDPKKKNFQFYKNVTILKPNLKEFKDGYNASVEQMIKDMNLSGAIITMAEKGLYINYKGEEHNIPAHISEITDVSGAGDTVSAVASLCLALNINPLDIALISNLAGGLVCLHSGVVPINKEELKNRLNRIYF